MVSDQVKLCITIGIGVFCFVLLITNWENMAWYFQTITAIGTMVGLSSLFAVIIDLGEETLEHQKLD